MNIACLLLQAALYAAPHLAWESHTNVNAINQLAVDSTGMSIYGTSSGGVLRFSAADTVLARHFTNIDGLPGIEATAIAVAPDNRKWIGTNGAGISCWSGTDAIGAGAINNDAGLRSDTIAALCYYRGAGSVQRLFAGMHGGLALIDAEDGAVLRNYYPAQGYPLYDTVRALAVRRDSLWVGTNGGVAVVAVSGIDTAANWTNYTGIGVSPNILALFADDTMIVAGTANGATRTASGATWLPFPGVSTAVRAITSVGDSLFFATSSGVKRYHNNVTIDRSAGLPSTNVRSLVVDRQQRLWAATDKGLSWYQNGTWHNYRFPGPGGNNCFRVAAAANGDVWLASVVSGASQLHGGQWQNFTQASTGQPIDDLSALAVDDRQAVWMGTWGNGVSRLDASGWRHYGSPPMPTPVIQELQPVGGGAMLVAQWSGDLNDVLSSWNYSDTIWHTYQPPTSSYRFGPRCLAFDDSMTLWIGSEFNGLYLRHPDGSWNNRMPNNKVNTLTFDHSGRPWIGTDVGLVFFDGAAFQPSPHRPLSQKINSIAVDRQGNLWIGGTGGLDLRTWDNHWYAFDRRDSYGTGSKLLSNYVNDIAIYQRDAGGDDILVATDKGLNIIHCSNAGTVAAQGAVVAPNPCQIAANGSVLLSRLPDRATVRVFTIDGRAVATADGPAAPAHQLLLRFGKELPRDLPSGIYLLHITSPGAAAVTLKLAVLR